jgi:hypothetical protein
MKFLDAAFPGSVDAMDQALQHERAQAFAFYIGGNNTTHAWPAAIVAGLLARGYQGASIWVPFPTRANGAADGQTAAAWTRAYGVRLAYVDIEAAVIAGGRPYCAAWNPAAKAGGMVTGGYSNATGITADEFDYDRAWCDTQGEVNPCDFGHCPGTPGRRAVQCGYGSWAGVSYDISFSEYDFGGTPMTAQQAQQLQDIWNALVQGGGSPSGTGGVGWFLIAMGQVLAATAANTGGETAAQLLNDLKLALNSSAAATAAAVLAVKTELDAVKAELEAGGSVDAASAIGRIEAALKAA